MKKIIFALILAVCLIAVLGIVDISNEKASAKNDKGEIKVKVFVHYPKPDVKSAKGGGGKPSRPSCMITIDDQISNYGLAGWKMQDSSTTVVYQINYNSRPAGLNQSAVKTAIANSFDVWDQWIDSVSFSEGPVSILTCYRLDGVNLVAWGTAPSGAIGVTHTWYYGGTGEWIESDTILNKRLKWDFTPYTSDCAGTANVYDVQNIMTHENGHWIGLDDLYDSASKDLTMYGYGMTSELKKDTLGLGDILGVDELY